MNTADRIIQSRPRERKYFLLPYLLPALLIYTVFMAAPILLSLRTSLYEWSGIGEMTFIGLDNYVKLFTDPLFSKRLFNALSNNVVMFIIMMVLQNGFGLVLAVLLTRGYKGSGFFRTIFFAPVTISVIIVGFLWTLIYNPTWGIINSALKTVNLGHLAMAWLGNESTALLCVSIAGVWQSIGLAIMIYVAAIQGITEDIYESARIDGCNEFKLFSKITFPLIVPSIGMLTILTLIGNFANSFDLIYAMQGAIAGPNYATDVLSTFFYRTAFGAYGSFRPDMGLGATIATVMFVIVFACVGLWLYLDARSRRAE